MSLATIIAGLESDVKKVDPIVTAAIDLAETAFPAITDTVNVVEIAVKGAAAAGLTLENDVEDFWNLIKPTVTTLVTDIKGGVSAVKAAQSPAPAAGAAS